MDNQLPEDVVTLMEQFIRDMSRLHCAVFGVVYTSDPIGIGMMRNTSEDPLQALDILRTLIQDAQRDGRVKPMIVHPLN